MQSGSQPNSSEPPPFNSMANLLGSIIALLTLVSPVFIVQRYSAVSPSRSPASVPLTIPRS